MTTAPTARAVRSKDAPAVGAAFPGVPAPTARPSRGERTWCLALPFAVAVLLSFAHTPDDGFITLRYAWNLVHGHGPVFNPGEHVLGASSALHLLLSTGVVLAPHSYALVVAKFVSLVFGALALWQGALLVAATDLPRWARRTGYLMLAGSAMLALSSANALETTLYCFLVTLLVRRLVGGCGTVAPFATGVLAALVVVTRPDGALVVAALALSSLLLERGRPRLRSVTWALGGLVGTVGLWGATVVFTGYPFPNTYYAKHLSLGRAVTEGARYLQTAILPGIRRHDALGTVSALLLLGLVAFVAAGAVVLVRSRSRMIYAVALVVGQIAFVLGSGGDWMRGGRFLVPALAGLVVVALRGAVAMVDRVTRSRPDLRRAAVVAGAGLLLAATLVPWATETAPVWRVGGALDDDGFVAVGGYGQYVRVWSALPKVMACYPGARLATTEVGNAGWVDPGKPVLDLRGLTDSVIAHDSPASARQVPGVALGNWSHPGSVTGRRILAWHPDLIVMLGAEAPMPRTALDGRYVERSWTLLADGGSIAVYSRPGLPTTCAEGDPLG